MVYRKEHVIDPTIKYIFPMDNARDQEKYLIEHQRYDM